MITALLLAVGVSFLSAYPVESHRAINLIEDCESIHNILVTNLGEEYAVMAEAIVAPEIAMYTPIPDIAEYRSLCLLYVLYGQANFSIGLFQMKPSFARQVEATVREDSSLMKKYEALIIHGSTEREVRKIRIDRLMQLDWQTLYLAAFIDIVQKITQKIPIVSPEEKVRHWATLYNAGINLTPEQVREMQAQKTFPHIQKTFNYGQAAVDFYENLSQSC